MSAHTEQLLIDVQDAEAALSEAREAGALPATVMKLAAEVKRLRSRLTAATEDLNESRRVLKG